MTSTIRKCHYVKTDGRRCGSPALKSNRYCYFHYEVNRAVAHLDIPPLEDGNAIQLALTDLARAIVEERIALKPAALLAYILQTASANLKRVHLGVFPDRMITELPSLDPYARGLAPLPGERNRDPEQGISEGHGFSHAKKLGVMTSSALPEASALQASDPRPSASIRGKDCSPPSAQTSSASGACPERSRGAVQASKEAS